MTTICYLLLAAWLLLATGQPAHAQYTESQLETTVLASDLKVPWELKWGPDDRLWFTERPGRVKRLDVETRQIDLLLDLDNVLQVQESGMLGMAFHPDFADTPDVFLSYTYRGEGGSVTGRISRFTLENGQLRNERILLEGIPGFRIHNGSRLVISPEGKLMVTTGDAGQETQAQALNSLAGKILRINLDGSIPADNPRPGSYIYSYGHRNPQGLVFLPDSTLISSEHGPSTDDEVNRIVAGANYGWPQVRGFCDRDSEQSFCRQNNVREPLMAWTPTLAVSGIDYYDHSLLSKWRGKLLMMTLKRAHLRVLTMNQGRDSIVREDIFFENQFGRLRDLAIGPDGAVYFSTSNRDGYSGRGWPKPGDDHIIRLRPKSAGNRDERALPSLSLFADPASDSMILYVPQGSKASSLSLYSLSGKKVLHREAMGAGYHRVSAKQLGSGLYLYRIQLVDGHNHQGKLIIR